MTFFPANRLKNKALLTGLILSAAMVNLPMNPAHAGTNQSASCAQVAASQIVRTVTPTTRLGVGINVVAGDVVTVTHSSGSVTINLRGFDNNGTAVTSNPTTPRTETIGPGNGYGPGLFEIRAPSVASGTFTISCVPAVVGPLPGANNSHLDQQTTGTILAARQFASDQASQINDEVASALLRGGSGGGGVVSYNGTTSVSVGLDDVMRQSRANQAIENTLLGYGEASGGYNGEPAPLLNAWIKAGYSDYSGDDADVDGSLFNAMVGLDYRLGETALIGVLAGYENSDFDFDVTNGTLEGDGLTIGVYAGVLVAPNVAVDVSVSHGWINYDNEVAGDEGSFDASRWILTANLTGSFDLNQVIIEPNASVFVSIESQDSYTTAGAVFVDDNDVTLGRISVGPKVLMPIMRDSGQEITLWALAKGEYDFSSEDTVVSSNFKSDDVFSARLGLGLDAQISDAASLGLSVEGHGLGSDEYNAVDFDAKLRLKF